VCGINPDKEFMLYSLTKAALINFTYALSKRYGNRIFVNCISPGFVESNLCGNDPVPPHLIEDIPMKRQAKPEEVAELVWNMINYKYLNGSNIVFDGGISAKHMGGY
jgi:3-oxoacyl-[acyl-carrier protein] reductase